MTKQHVQSLWRFFWISLGLAVCLLLSSTVSFGEIKPTSSATATDCRLVANPDECYHNQNRQKWSPYTPNLPAINTELFGLEGPFRAELRYDADLSWILGQQYLHMFNESAGIAVKLTGGPNEFRSNITAGYAFNKDHQVKFTYEYLTQNLPFDFASGTIKEWVAQHSLGAAYQYVIRHEIVHSLEISGYITRARSKDLDDVIFNQQTIVPGSDYIYDVNYRRIAGGKEDTVLASVNLFPFATPTTTLTLGVGYSSISYDTKYEDNQASTTLAYKAELAHLLSSKAKVTASTTGTAGSKEHSVGVSHLLPNNFEVSLKGQYTQGQGTLKDNKSVTLGFTYPAPDSYSLGGFNEVQELKNWIDKPVVYATRVLAIKDELVKRFEAKSIAALADQEKFFYDQLTPVPTSTAFSFDPNLPATYTLLVEKIAPSSNQKATPNRDYTKDLNLALVATGPNQATLQSATSDGIPPTDTTGASNEGVYKITITIALTMGKMPIVMQNGFKLTVKGPHSPDWDDTSIPDAKMGYAYPPSQEAVANAKNSNGLEDLTAKVKVHLPDTSVVFSILDGPTAWLAIQDCPPPAPTGHKCLASVGGAPVPKNVPDKTFSATILATPVPSGENPSQKTFTAQIIQLAPKWDVIPTQHIDVNGSQEQKTVSLKKYIIDGTKGLIFQTGPGFDTTNWSLSSDGNLTFIGTNPSYLGLKSVPVVALNDTSYAGSSTNIPVDLYNSTLAVNWVGNTLPDAQAGMPYSKNLNELSDIVNPLLQTLNGTTPLDDRYDFEILPSPSQGDWKLDTDDTGAVSLLTGTNLKVDPVTKIGSVSIVFKAKSHAANKYATPEQQTVTLKVTQNHSLNPAWTGEKELVPGAVGTPYDKELAAASGKVLVQTFSGTLPLDPPDTYGFEKKSGATGWSFDSAANKLSNPFPLRGLYEFAFTALSNQAGELATGGTGVEGDDTQQKLTVNVPADNTLDVAWVRSEYPIHIPAGKAYAQDLNKLKDISADYALVKTKKGTTPIDADVYTFSKISSVGGWDVPESSNELRNSEPMVGQTNQIVLTAKSFQADKLATPEQQTINIIVDPNPDLNVTWINNKLNKVGTVGQKYTEDLAAVQTREAEALVKTDNSPHDTYTFSVVGQSANPRPGDWYVPEGTSILTNDSPPLAAEGVIVPLQAISKQTGKAASGGSEGKILVKINPDTSLAVKWTGQKDIPVVATTARAYEVDLNELNRDKTPEMVQTLRADTPIAGDDYTFTVLGQKPTPEPGDWYIRPGETILRNDAVPQPDASGQAHVTIGVKSLRAPTATATGGDGPDPSLQIINITVDQNPDFIVNWTGNDTLKHQGTAGAKYTQDLSGSPAVDNNPIVITRDGTLPFGDSYIFKVVGQSPTPQPGDWYVAADGVTLTNDNPAISPKEGAKVLLSVQSKTDPAAPVIGGNGPEVSQQYIKVVINKNPELQVNWIADKQLPIVTKAGEMIDPQSLSLNGAKLITTTGHPEDIYAFSWADGFNPPAGWSLSNQDILKKATLSLIGTEELVFEADSAMSGSQAQGGNMSGEGHPNWQKYTIVTVPNADLNVNWTERKKLPDADAGEVYKIDLTLAQAAEALVATTNSTGAPVTGDTYVFSTTDSDWTIDGSTLKSNAPLLVDEPGKPKTIQVHLKALSVQQGKTKYASGGSKGDLNITINADPNNLVAKWTGKHKVMPTASAFDTTYSVDLAKDFPAPDSLVETRNKKGQGDVISDTYTFTQVADPLFPELDDWDIVNNKLVYVGDPTLGPKVGQYRMAIQAQSTQAYPEVANGGTDGSTDRVQIITINVAPDTTLNVNWKQNTFPMVAKAGVPYVVPDFNLVTPVFVQTDRSGTLVKEAYAYHLKTTSPTPAPPTRGQWTFDEANNKLTVTGLIPDADAGGQGAVAYFSAFSKAKGSDAANMTGLDPRNDQPLTLHVTTNSDLQPKWTDNPTLIGTPGSTTYTVDLNEYNTVTKPKTLVFTTPTDDDPYYDFTFVSVSTGSCEPITAGIGGRLGKLTCKDLSGSQNTLKLKAKSRNAGKFATITKGTGDDQEVILNTPIVPIVPATNGNIAFSKVKLDSAGDPKAFNLDQIVTNKATFKALKFDWCQAGTTPLKCDETVPASTHWKIAQWDPATPSGDHFLIRTKDDNTVYAGDVGDTFQPLVAVRGQFQDGTWSDPTIIGQGTSILKMVVDPDPTVQYKYADTAPEAACKDAKTGQASACALVAITSDGKGGRVTSYKQPTFPEGIPGTLKTFLADKTPVVGDSGATFLTNSTTPTFMKLSGNNLTFEMITGGEYITYATKSPFSTYLRVKSKASGDTGLPDVNLDNLPAVTANKLILVPYNGGPVNNGFQTDNMGPNVFVGISPTQIVQTSACDPGYVRTITSLKFNLPAAPSGYSYYLTSLTPQWGGGGIATDVYICKGLAEAPATYGSFAGANGQKTCGGPFSDSNFTWDSTAIQPQKGVHCRGGSDVQLPSTPFAGAGKQYPLAGGNQDYVLAITAQNYNSGLTNNFQGGTGLTAPPAIPNPDMSQKEAKFAFKDDDGKYSTLLSRGLARIAPMLGDDYVNYSNFPVVELLPN